MNHPFDTLRRQIPDNEAKQRDIDEIWLEKWWRYIDKARNAVNDVRWIND
jgi:hypothetical protein